MPVESGLWTVLPNGIDEETGRLRATLFFSPRLTQDVAGGKLLQDYPLLSDWTAVVAGMKFVLEFDGTATVDAVPDPTSTQPDAQRWHTVFGPDVGVVDHTPKDLSDMVVNSFPANAVASDLLSVYAQVGTSSPFALPPVTSGPLADFALDIGWIGVSPGDDAHPALRQGFAAEHSQVLEDKHGRYLPRAQLQTMGRFGLYATTQRFYDRYLNGVRVRNPDAAGVPELPKPERPPIDFHGYVAALGDYPQLLRQLGLAVDLVLDDPGLPVHGKVRVLFPDPPAAWFQEPEVAPWTHYEYDLPWFLPRPRDDQPIFSRGQLDFHKERLWVHQIDIDGSVLKALNAATSLVTQKGQVQSTGGPSMTKDEGSLPALRGAGLTVVRDDRAESVVAQFDQQVKAEEKVASKNPAELYAEDVTRGYFVDVDKDGRGFASLCRRIGRYAIRHLDGSEEELPVPSDEGYVKGASTTAVPGDKQDLYLHESMFSWSGWSMVAGRPGRRLRPEETLEEPDTPLEVDPVVPLVTSFRPEDGSLTPLRYGATYRIRARLADLAGNSVRGKALDEADQEPSAPQVYRRWEPVPAPVILPRRGYGEGESQLRMVVRSTLGLTPDDYVTLPRVVGLAGHQGDTAYRADDSRWVVAPKTSQQMAELHGVFDKAFGGGPAEIAEQFAIAERESGVLPDLVPDGTLTLPYLPDVSSRSASFWVLPGLAPGESHLQEWPSDGAGAPWWDRQPFRIEIVAGPADAPVTPVGPAVKPEWVDGQRVLRVAVPQAELVRVSVSSGINEDDLDIQGGWSLVKSTMSLLKKGQALLGRIWMVTPSLELVLVHAVEKPLLPPVVDVPQAGMARNSGETFCALVGTIDNHAKSTGRLDVEATWTEQVDDLGSETPLDGADGRGLLDGHAHVGDFQIEATEDDCRVGRTNVTGNGLPTRHELRHQLGDTRHRYVRYQARATTRFREYFPAEIATTLGEDDVPLMEHHGAQVPRHVPSSRRPDPPEVAYVIPTFSWTETTELEQVIRTGPQQAIPRPRTITVRTRTCGLRVYLKRPWFSSGDGELLGVVLRKQPWLTWEIDEPIGMVVPDLAKVQANDLAQRIFDRGLVVPKGAASQAPSTRLLRGAGARVADAGEAPLTELAAPLVEALDGLGAELGTLFPHIELPAPDSILTAWGADPAYLSVGPSGGPFIHHFGLRVDVAPEVAPAEEQLAKVTVVGHQPSYDVNRRLWYCDIELPAGSAYTPFVRLALCRYQRWSIPGCEISKVVRADYAQLLPRRELQVRNGTPKRVTLRGPVGSPSSDSLGARRVQARVESRPAGGTDLDWRPLGVPVQLDGSLSSSGLAEANWSGNITPLAAPEGHERRLLVEEFESFLSDPDPDDPLEATRTFEFPFLDTLTFRERLVYADSVPL